MIKTRRLKLNLSNTQFALVKETSQECARCWNECIKNAKEYYNQTHKWKHKYHIQPDLKGKFNLHSQTIQAITDKFSANRKTACELRKQGNLKIKYPYKEKRFYVIPLKKSAINYNNKGNLKLTLGNKKYLELDFSIKDIKTAEIVYKNGYYFYYTFDDGIEAKATNGTKTIGVDLGEIHSIASVTNDGKSLIISNRLGRSLKQYRNKMYAKIEKRLSRCKKGSRKYRQLKRLKYKLKLKIDNSLTNLYHQTTKKFIDFCIENNIKEIVIGDVKGIEKNTKKEKRLNRKNRQKVSQMEYGRIIDYIKYKAKEKGKKVVFVNEAYTSQTCPKCKKKHKPRGRDYICSCGYKTHRDIVGAWNILNKEYKYDLVDFCIKHKQPVNL